MITNLVIGSTVVLGILFVTATFELGFYIINIKHKAFNDMFIITAFVLCYYVQVAACLLYYYKDVLILELFVLESLLQALPTLQMLFNYFPRDINRFIPILISTPYILSIAVSLFRFLVDNEKYQWLNQINIASGQVFTIQLNLLIVLVIFKQQIWRSNIYMLIHQAGSMVQQFTFLMLVSKVLSDNSTFIGTQLFRSICHIVSIVNFIIAERAQYKKQKR